MKGSIVYSNLWETWAIHLLIEFSMRAKKWDILLFTGELYPTLPSPQGFFYCPDTFIPAMHVPRGDDFVCY